MTSRSGRKSPVRTVLRAFGSKDELIYAALGEMAAGGVFLKPTPPGDVKAGVSASFDIYEAIGDSVIRRLNDEQRRPALKPLLDQGRENHRDAEKLGVQVMEASTRMLGQEHPDTLWSMTNLASTYRKQGRWKEAEELEVQAMEASTRMLGQEHPDTLASKDNLAMIWMDQGRWKEAEGLEVQVLTTRERVLGQEHPETLTSMDHLASTLKSQGRDDEAVALMAQCVNLRKKKLGVGHPDTVSSLEELNDWQVEERPLSFFLE